MSKIMELTDELRQTHKINSSFISFLGNRAYKTKEFIFIYNLCEGEFVILDILSTDLTDIGFRTALTAIENLARENGCSRLTVYAPKGYDLYQKFVAALARVGFVQSRIEDEFLVLTMNLYSKTTPVKD